MNSTFIQHTNTDKENINFVYSNLVDDVLISKISNFNLQNSIARHLTTYKSVNLEEKVEDVIKISPEVNIYLLGRRNGYNDGYAAALKDLDEMIEELNILSADNTKIEVIMALLDQRLGGIEKKLDESKDKFDKILVIENNLLHIKDSIEEIKKKRDSWVKYVLMPVITGVVLYLLNLLAGLFSS